MSRLPARTIGFIRHVLRENRGLAAVEFAMIAPLLLTVFLGSIEFSQALTLDRRVTAVASATADLITQSEQVSPTELDKIMGLGQTIMKTALVDKFEPAKFSIDIISVVSDADGNVTVDWSYDESGGQPYAPGSTYPNMPAGLTLQPLQSLVFSEVKYTFTPLIGKFLSGSVDLEERLHLSPRRSAKVELVP